MLDVGCWMLDVFCAPFCILHSSFCIPCEREVQGSRFKVQGPALDVGCWMYIDLELQSKVSSHLAMITPELIRQRRSPGREGERT